MTSTNTSDPAAGPVGTPAAGVHGAGDELLVSFLRLARALKSVHPQELEPPQSFILHVMCENARVRLSDLAGMIRLDASTASRHIRGLEQLGYVERATDPADGRATLLSVTDDGREALERQFEANRKRIKHIMRDWTGEDVAALQHYLARLTRDVEIDQSESSHR
jgi:DNA-binding MarR family transcriptional regulator